MTALLELDGVDAFYGQSHVLHGIRMTVPEGGVTALIGANGAGKTTLLRAISRVCRTRGEIRFDGARIDGLSIARAAGRGIAHVPDGRGTLAGMTVEENLRVGGWLNRDRARRQGDMERIYGYFPRLRERRLQQAGTLSGGEQQMLAIGRALMQRPRLLMLDEPSFGLAPLIVTEIFAIMRRIREDDGITILLVEQNVQQALSLASQACLIEHGQIVATGTAAEFRNNEQIRRSYMGV